MNSQKSKREEQPKKTGSVFDRDENGIRRQDLEYGDFPDDGYDYSQHFAERGNGIFIQADGKVIQSEDRKQIDSGLQEFHCLCMMIKSHHQIMEITY